jgi:hypothetical protein
MKNFLSTVWLLVTVLVCVGSTAWAQGFAPAPGTMSVKIGTVSNVATEAFAGLDELRSNPSLETGSRVDFYSTGGEKVGGELQIHELAGSFFYVPWAGVTTSVAVPLLKYVRYRNDTNGYTTTALGPGDVTTTLGYQWTPQTWSSFGSTLASQLKIPTSFGFPYTDEAMLGDGQVDVGLSTQNTLRLGVVSVDASLSYVHRRPNKSDGRELRLGDEWRFSGSVGGAPTSALWVSLGYTGSVAQKWEIREAGEAWKELIQPQLHAAVASLYWTLTSSGESRSALDLWFKVPVAGQDIPVLWSGGVGYVLSMLPGNS